MLARRTLLTTVAATGGTALGITSIAASSAGSESASPLRAKLLSRWDPNFPFQYAAAVRLAQRVKQLSQGRLLIEVQRSSDLGAIDKTFDAVRSGQVQMARTLSYEWRSRSAAFTPFFVMPFGMTETEVGSWVRSLGGQALWDELYAPFNLKPLLVGALGAQAFGFFKREINSAADLSGLRYRTTGSTVAIANAAGMKAVDLPPPRIRPAMEAGEIDAFELVGPVVDLALGVHGIAPYYYWPGFHQPSGAVELILDKAWFDRLPDDLNVVIGTAAEAEHHANVHEVYAGNARALRELAQRHGVQVRRVNGPVMAELARATNEVWDALYAGSSGLDRRIYDSFLSARSLMQPWTAITDHDFVSARDTQQRYFGKIV
jgi:TRAP-type mannitol/chloroaromatic compound transport system substrate-binding protein